MAALAGFRRQLAQQARAAVVIDHHQRHQQQLGMQPAPRKSIAQPQPHTERQRRHGQHGGKAQQTLCHANQALTL